MALLARPASFLLLLALALEAGCDLSGIAAGGPTDAAAPRDLTALVFFDEGLPPTDDLAQVEPGPCELPLHAPYGPPDRAFALSGDVMPDPLVKSNGIQRDATTGYLKLDATHSSFNYVWVPNRTDPVSGGTVSKIDNKTIREVARYPSVTCSSLKAGSTADCDGTKGCCSLDDAARYAARQAKLPEPGHQAVSRLANVPGRVVVDFNGEAFVGNEGAQGSVTHIANDVASCIDRNRTGQIDSSRDTNGDGWIDTDCNADGVGDDLASVKARPCTNGLPQEYFGLDDECVLWTSNVFDADARLRGLALGQGDPNSNTSDAWAVAQKSGAVVRLAGATGLIYADRQLPNDCLAGSGPFGLAIDASGIGWVPPEGSGKLCYFDTKIAGKLGVARDPNWGQANGYGISMDRDQNVWLGGAVARYTPDRSNGWNNLGNGWWTLIAGASGLGIGPDSRSANAYYVYSCKADRSGALQIPASTIKIQRMDQQVAPLGWPTITMPCYGVVSDSDQNIWGFGKDLSTRALVDKKGAITQPKVDGPPQGMNRCPAGDSCPSLGGDVLTANNAGFGLRNGIARPTGTYEVLVRGCVDGQGAPRPTVWGQLTWDADVPPNTTLTVQARSGNSDNFSAMSWQSGTWSDSWQLSPVCLQDELTPNPAPPAPGELSDSVVLIEFVLKTSSQNATPKLRSFDVSFACK